MKKSIFVLLLSLLNVYLFAEVKGSLNLETPRNAVYSHIFYLVEPNVNEKLASNVLKHPGYSEAKRIELAVKLKKVLDAKGLYIDFADIPNNPNYFDSTNNEASFVLFKEYPQISVKKYGDHWLYSIETLEAIPTLYKQTFKFGDDFLPNLFPKTGDKKFTGMYIWQWYSLLILTGIIILLYIFFNWLFGYIIFKLVNRFFGQEIAKKFILPVARPLSTLLLIGFIWILWPLFLFDVSVNETFLKIIRVIASIYGMMIFYRLVDVLGAYLNKAALKTESTLDDQLVPLVNKSLKIFVIIVGSIFILQNFGLRITALLAGLSIGGLAFALAAQDTIKNLFGSLMIFLDKPFQIGDWIVADNVDGTVEEVGFRSTKVRTFKNSLITIPNGKLADQAVDNMGARQYRRLSTNISITYDTPPEKIEAFVYGIKEIIKAHPHTRKDYYIVELNELSAYSLDILLYTFFIAETWILELKYRHELLIAIIRLAEKLKIRFAFPTETLFIEEIPGQNSLTPQHNRNTDEAKKLTQQFLGSLRRSKAYNPALLKRNTQQTSTHANEKNQNQGDRKQKLKFRSRLSHDQNKKVEKTIEKAPEKKVPEKKATVEKVVEKKRDDIPQKPKVVSKVGKELIENEIRDVAKTLNLDSKILQAVVEVESKGNGFYANGKPEIQFEGHRFWNELVKKGINPEELAEKNPDIIYQRWTKKYYKGNEKEYERLERAKEIDKEAAYLSTRWGRFKMLGATFSYCELKSISEFVYKQYQTEKEQLECFAKFIKSRKMVDDLQQLKWKSFARKYNGPNFARANYHTKLEEKYNNLKNNN